MATAFTHHFGVIFGVKISSMQFIYILYMHTVCPQDHY